MKLDLTAGADQDAVLDELAKQLSAFSNMGGGQIIYGLSNNGDIDGGGVSRLVTNVGILLAYDIRFAVDLIRKHPDGPKTVDREPPY